MPLSAIAGYSAPILIAVCVIVVALLGLGFHALNKIKPEWLRIHTSVLRVITFTMEIGRPGTTRKPDDELRQLDAGDSNDDG